MRGRRRRNRIHREVEREIGELVRGELKKSGLGSEAITRVLRLLEQNGQVLRNPYNICKILV